MKICVVVIIILMSAVLASAEQISVTIYTQATWGGSAPFLETDCKELCFKNGNINDYLSKGWHVVTTQAAQVTQSQFKSNTTWCRCTGTEYILQR